MIDDPLLKQGLQQSLKSLSVLPLDPPSFLLFLLEVIAFQIFDELLKRSKQVDLSVVEKHLVPFLLNRWLLLLVVLLVDIGPRSVHVDVGVRFHRFLELLNILRADLSLPFAVLLANLLDVVLEQFFALAVVDHLESDVALQLLGDQVELAEVVDFLALCQVYFAQHVTEVLTTTHLDLSLLTLLSLANF